MEVQFGPNSVDEPNLLFKLQRKIKVFNTSDPLPNRGYNLVASSSKYGLVFVAVPDGLLTVYHLKQLVDNECEPQHMSMQLQEKPTHIAVSCDSELLAVTGGQLLCVYKVADFQNSNVSPSVSIRTEMNPSTFVSALQWNPCIPDSIAIAYYDGTLLACLVSSGQMRKVPSKARCICWSPKGKQLVTGNSDGTLIQYKPDLTKARIVPAPNLFERCPVEAMAIYWISTFQFAVVYKNATDNSRPAVTIINAPKGGQPSCLTYEDICYSMGSNRPWYYFLEGLAQWNIIMTSSSNSMEIGTLGSADGANWLQWCQTDEARPELPLTDKKIENYPVGICIDTCAIHQLPWGENDTLPHMPLLHVVSQSGLLITFNVINMKKDAMQVCSPPQLLSLPAHAMSSTIPGEAPAQSAPPPATAPVPKPEPTPALVSSLQHAPQSSMPHPVSQFGAATVTAASIKIPSFTPQTSLPSAASAPAPEQKHVVANKPPPPAPALQPKPQHFAAPKSQQMQPTPQQTQPIPQQTQPTPQQTQPTPQQTQPTPQQTQPIPQQTQPTPQQTQPIPQQTQPTPQQTQPTPQQMQENAALKAEQDKINKMKANQELKNMLVKEVNDFQMELYNFMVKTRETQAKLQRDIETINTNFIGTSIDTEQLKKECSIEELRGAIVQLKLELVRACAVVAEARTHSDAKDLHQWTQADPLTTKRVASVKKLAYYVQTQLEQAHKALDHKWNELASKDPQFNKPGRRMIRPILDDVYQPLVKQQEILGRQQAVLRTLKNTLLECDVGPVFKSTSLLRSTPFRNNKDPLSKLTKNILNMSIDSETKPKQSLLTAQKLDALRDVLSNHKTVKIKPVNIELRQHLATMRKNYEKSMRDKALLTAVKTEPKAEVKPQVQPAPPQPVIKMEPKPEPPKQTVSAPAFKPPSNIKPVAPPLANVARTLFTDEPKPDQQKPQAQVQRPLSKPFGFSALEPTSVDTKSILKDVLTNKQANLEAKNNNSTFMGQKICTPSAFAQSSAPTVTAAPSAAFTSKPIADINNMFTKFQPQPFVPESKSTLNVKPVEKPLPNVANVKSSETGEPEDTAEQIQPKPFEFKPKDKPITNLFAMKTTPVATSTPIAPDILKNTIQAESKVTVKPLVKLTAKTTENIPEQSSASAPKKTQDVIEKKELKPLSTQAPNKSFVFGAPTEAPSVTVASSDPKPLDLIAETKQEVIKVSEKSDAIVSSSSSASSIFSSANADATAPKPQSVFATPPETAKLEAPTTSPESDRATDQPTPTVSASSIFGAAVASQPKTTSSIFSSPTSVSSTESPEASVFGTSKPSIFNTSPPAFGTATTASSVFGQTTTTQSVFSSTAASVFASASSSQPPSPSATVSAFGAPATTVASVFGSASPASVFGTATTAAPAFGSTSVFGSASPNAQSSVFGATPTTPAVFGSSETAPGALTPTTTSIFGSATSTGNIFSTATTQASVFGQPAQSVFGATTQASIFGAAPQASVFGSSGQTSLFGSPPTTQASLFGTPAPTTQASIFGTPTATTQASIFGTPTATTQASIFGTPTATTQASIFGTPTPTTQASIFGTPTPTTQASVFGTPPQANQASVFGTPIQTTQASVFGTPTQATPASIFGQPATTSQGSLFGGGEANLFAAASISTTSAPAANSGGNIFGGSSPSSVFGGGSTNVFGGKTTFRQPSPAATNIFGGSATFGQKPATNFWGSGNSESGFGSTAFGQTTSQASSIFGGTTGGSFSQPSAGAFGTPQQPSAFGSPQQLQQAPAFGGSPVFGSKPVFGQSSGFGSPGGGGGFGAPATFGGFNTSPTSGGFGAPAFGGGGGFGGGSPGGGFGSPTQSNATFESLATQNTLTFGNLAQHSGPAQQAAPSFNTSPSFTGWRG